MVNTVLNLVSVAYLFNFGHEPVQYKIDINFTQTVDYSPLGGPIQHGAASVSGYLTMSESDTVGGQIAAFKFDSVVVHPGEGLPANLAASSPAGAIGVVYRGLLVNGRPVNGFKTSKAQPYANLFQSALEAIYPGFPNSCKPGDAWKDSTSLNDSIPFVKSTTTNISWQASSVAAGLIAMDGAVTGSIRSVQKTTQGDLISNAELTGNRKLSGLPGGTTEAGTITTSQKITAHFGEEGEPFNVKVEHAITITKLTRSSAVAEARGEARKEGSNEEG